MTTPELLLKLQTQLELVNILVRSPELFETAKEKQLTELLIVFQSQADQLLGNLGRLSQHLVINDILPVDFR